MSHFNFPARSHLRTGARPPAGRRRTGERGFSIVEVAMATFVMAFGIATSIVALQMGFQSIDVARDQTLASQIMQSEIERLRLWPWSKSLPAGVVDSITELPASATVPLGSTFTTSAAVASKFTVTRTVSTDPDDATRNVRYITISVNWNTYNGRPQSRNFTTIYAKDGLYDYYYTLAKSS